MTLSDAGDKNASPKQVVKSKVQTAGAGSDDDIALVVSLRKEGQMG